MNTVLYFQSQSKTNAGEKLGGVQNIAAKCEWLVQVVEGLPPPKRLKELVEFWSPVGAIVECGGTAATVDPAVFGPLPVVFLDHDPSCLPKNAFCVTHDSAATAKMAARELMLGGAQSFAFVPYPARRFWSDERERGFISALSLNGRACRVFGGRPSSANPTRYPRELRAFLLELPKPCALFAANDWTAAEVLNAAAFAGVKVPDDLAVVGVDDAHDICERTTPTLSSVKPDFQRGGELAALLLAARLRDKADFKGPRQRTFGPLMVVARASTRRLGVCDGVVASAIELIRREACSGLAACDVLKRFPCSRRQAEIRFRRATGHSVLDEIHTVQLERAKRLLLEGSLPLKAISDFCGFQNPNSLRKFFRKETGQSMTDWRNGRRRAYQRPTAAR
ncbi:MAG: substrate-binding domain-containing protein [Kiritimatiellae bacterium]|nr:substrate-binding domain-containing protein [Kiritimatiellia bacterium]